MQKQSPYKGKKVAVLGLSIEGADAVEFFCGEGATVICCDRRTKEALGEQYEKLATYPVTFRLGDSYLRDMDEYDLVIRTPGMALGIPELRAVSQAGKLSSVTNMFFALCQAPIVGVTGTKGKGTTSTLIARMLEASGKRVYLGGNVGTPLLSRVRTIQSTDWVVLELSSFQLEDAVQSPHIAVVLRVTQDHLANFDTLASNFHASRDEYVRAKRSIVRFQHKEDVAVVNLDDETSASFRNDTKAHVYTVSRNTKADAYVKDHVVYIQEGNTAHRLVDRDTVLLRGDHNLENIAAASLAARAAGVSLKIIADTASKFEGLPHRLQFVREAAGVTYINDSFSTVPETTIAALDSFDAPITLIVGGSEKGSDFEELGKRIAHSSVQTLIVIGDMTEKIVRAVQEAGYTRTLITGLTTMHDIVASARTHAEPGSVVLLSPACASFGLFKNYKDRANQFMYEVNLL